MFVNRQPELTFLNSGLDRKRPTAAQFILLYGRRRVGKTVLLRHWAEQVDGSHTYWAAEKEPAALQRRKLFARLLGVEPARAATFDSWADCWQAIAAFLADRHHILILDEFTYAVESDPAMLSLLQHAWDQQFKNSQVILVLCGSHVHTMETPQARRAPLFGRLTAQCGCNPCPLLSCKSSCPAGRLMNGWQPTPPSVGYPLTWNGWTLLSHSATTPAR